MELTMELENKVKAMCEKRHMAKNEFMGECLKAGLSYDTASRLYAGETGFNTTTLATVATLLKCNISDLIDTKK